MLVYFCKLPLVCIYVDKMCKQKNRLIDQFGVNRISKIILNIANEQQIKSIHKSNKKKWICKA